MPKYTIKQFKSVLNKRKYIDSWFWDRYAVSPYNGCVHNCIYCDSRSQKYYMPDNFGEDIIIKKNIAEMLDQKMNNARNLLPDVVGAGGASDSFMACEKKYRNTENILKVLHKHKFPVFIATKSTFVTDYIDLLDQIAADTWCSVGITITTTNNKTGIFLEPKASLSSERFKAIEKLKAKSKMIQVGVLFIPIVIGFSDNEENIVNMIKKAKDSGADYILFGGGATLRDKQADYFLNILNSNYPELIPKYEKLYKFKYIPDNYNGRYGPDWDYTIKIHEKLFELCEQYKLEFRMRRFIPNDYRKNNYIISEMMLRESYKDQMLGIDSSDKHWAAMNIQNLKRSVNDYVNTGQLGLIKNVNKQLEKYIIKNLPDERTNPTLF